LFDPDRIAASAAQVDSLLDLMPLSPTTRVLDLCCGIGRH
jgi:cyclopropane fatty-acyl-phospholipid synthase-like methyltransferase